MKPCGGQKKSALHTESSSTGGELLVWSFLHGSYNVCWTVERWSNFTLTLAQTLMFDYLGFKHRWECNLWTLVRIGTGPIFAHSDRLMCHSWCDFASHMFLETSAHIYHFIFTLSGPVSWLRYLLPYPNMGRTKGWRAWKLATCCRVNVTLP